MTQWRNEGDAVKTGESEDRRTKGKRVKVTRKREQDAVPPTGQAVGPLRGEIPQPGQWER